MTQNQSLLSTVSLFLSQCMYERDREAFVKGTKREIKATLVIHTTEDAVWTSKQGKAGMKSLVKNPP